MITLLHASLNILHKVRIQAFDDRDYRLKLCRIDRRLLTYPVRLKLRHSVAAFS